MANFDLKLLAVIGELHRTRSVSQAAERLGLSQSAVSMSLAKLRKHFNDPLFVRTSTGMEPIPHAIQLIDILGQAQDLLQTAFGRSVVFDARTSDRLFHIQSTDIAQVTLMPKLMQHLRKVAPLVRIDLQRLAPNTPKLLESGELDLAVGFILPMGAGFCQQRLFKERFVCATRSDHPRIGNSLTVKAFENESHLAVATSGTAHNVIEKMLEAHKIRRRVSLTVPSFLGIASIITSSDNLVILPEQLGRHLAAPGNIKVLSLPFEIPTYYIMQHWHERYSQDPANQWFRNVIADLFRPARGYQLH
jgi:DNA-binding transcriptional LysR family regulator